MDDNELAAKAQHLESVVAQGDPRKLGAALLQEYLAMGSDRVEFSKLLEKTKSLNDSERKRSSFLPSIDFTDPGAKNFEVDMGKFSPGLPFLFTGALDKHSTKAFEVKKENPEQTLGVPDDIVGDGNETEVTIVDGAKPEMALGNSVLISQNGATVDSILPFTVGVARPNSKLVVSSPYEDGKVCAESGSVVQVNGKPEYAEFYAEPKANIQGNVYLIPVPEGFCEKVFLPTLLQQMAK